MHTYVGFAKYTYMYTLLLVLAPSPPMHAPIPLASGPLLVLVGTVPPRRTSMSPKWTNYFIYIYVDTYVVWEARV